MESNTGAPAEVVASNIDATALALDETDLYAESSPYLVRVPKSGGQVEQLLHAAVGQISVDSQYVYFTSIVVDGVRSEGIWRLHKTTRERTRLVDEPTPSDFAVDGSISTAIAKGLPSTTGVSKALYWVSKANGMLRRLRLDDALAQPEDIASAASFGANLVMDGERLYFGMTSPREIRSVAMATGEMTTIASLGQEPRPPLVVDQSRLYVPVRYELTAFTKEDGARSVLVSDATPFGAASDGKSLYWTDISQCSLRAFDLGAGTARTVMAGQRYPTVVAIDDNHVYWGVLNDRLLLRIAKP